MTKNKPLQSRRMFSKVLAIGITAVLFPIFLLIAAGQALEELEAKKYLFIFAIIFSASIFAVPAKAETELTPYHAWEYQVGNQYQGCCAGSGWPASCTPEQSWWNLARWNGLCAPAPKAYNETPTEKGSGTWRIGSVYSSGSGWYNTHGVMQYDLTGESIPAGEVVTAARIVATQDYNYDAPSNKPTGWFLAMSNGQDGFIVTTSAASFTDFVASTVDGVEILEWHFNQAGLDFLDWELRHGIAIYLEPLTEFNYSSSTPTTDGVSDLSYSGYHEAHLFYTTGSPTPPPPAPPVGNLSAAGVSIASTWFCCNGACGYPISMLTQLGWWGIGSTTTRIINWGLDNAPLTNTINFSTSTNGQIQIPTSTPVGYHTIKIKTYIDGSFVASGTARIQIVAGAQCITTFDYNLSYFCAYPCNGLVTSTNPLDLANFECGLRRFGCFMVKPTPDSISYVLGQFYGLTANFPLAPFTKAYDDFSTIASGTQAFAPGTISLPIYSTSSQHYVATYYNLGSSSAVQSYGFIKFKRFESILIWLLLAVAPTIFVLWRLITPL